MITATVREIRETPKGKRKKGGGNFMSEKEKKERKVTPIGEAKWAYLDKPKPAFADPKTGKSKGEPKYQIDVVFDPKDPEWGAWGRNLSEAIKAMGGSQSPIKKEFNQNDEHTGRYYVTFKTSDKFQPKVFDKAGNILEGVKIGNGSKVRVSYIENEYTAFGGGINLYLNAVQVIELVEFGNYTAEAYGFDVEPEEVTEWEPF